jgi:hypothetical protein
MVHTGISIPDKIVAETKENGKGNLFDRVIRLPSVEEKREAGLALFFYLL